MDQSDSDSETIQKNLLQAGNRSSSRYSGDANPSTASTYGTVSLPPESARDEEREREKERGIGSPLRRLRFGWGKKRKSSKRHVVLRMGGLDREQGATPTTENLINPQTFSRRHTVHTLPQLPPPVLREEALPEKIGQTIRSIENFRVIEGLDYVRIENLSSRLESLRTTSLSLSLTALLRTLAVVLIGLLTGTLIYGINYSVDSIYKGKERIVEKVMGKFWTTVGNHTSGIASFSSGSFAVLCTSLSLNLSLATLACLSVLLIMPTASGSGVPEVKGYLNGCRLPKAFNVKTLITKVISVTFAVSSGLPVGPEGPMIHIGGLIGGGVGEFRSRTLGFSLPFMKRFRNARDRRDFITSGVASGVASAFSAPIGGILFSLEEVSSFWSQELTWNSFIGCAVATFVVHFFLSGYSGRFGTRSIILEDVRNTTTYTIYELVPFILMGLLGGLLGALFTQINVKVETWRQKAVVARGKSTRYLEVFLLITFISLSTHFLSLSTSCKPLSSIPNQNATHFVSRFLCPENYYSELASLFLAKPFEAVRALFSTNTLDVFGYWALSIYSISYSLMAIYTAGSAISSGLFVPMMLSGAAWGRLIGKLIRSIFNSKVIDPGTYALIGASAMLSGVLRMTVTVVVILVELTDDLSLLFPIMLVVICSRLVADHLSHPLYDQLLALKRVPYLEPNPTLAMQQLSVYDIMARAPISFRIRERVGNIFRTLGDRKFTHCGFPVVVNVPLPNGESQQLLCGLILRRHLLVLLKERVWERRDLIGTADFQGILNGPRVYISEIKDTLSPEDTLATIDLGMYMDACPISVQEHYSVALAYRQFRANGLRHLPVTNRWGECTGILTRKDFYLVQKHTNELLDKIKEDAPRVERIATTQHRERVERDREREREGWDIDDVHALNRYYDGSDVQSGRNRSNSAQSQGSDGRLGVGQYSRSYMNMRTEMRGFGGLSSLPPSPPTRSNILSTLHESPEGEDVDLLHREEEDISGDDSDRHESDFDDAVE